MIFALGMDAPADKKLPAPCVSEFCRFRGYKDWHTIIPALAPQGHGLNVRLLRVAQIQQELQLLDGTVEKGFVSQDRTFAAMSDFQGMGGRGRTAWSSVVPYSANSLFQVQASSRRNAQGIHAPKNWQK
jgi:hypothetical protein